MTAYYNEIDPRAAAWLRELIKGGHIAAGDVDETDIRDVDPARLGRYTQCHFFAGIGGWSHALRLAGWPDDRPVWTGSCPCQPFSAAGRRAGQADERHLWPHWHHLISVCRPSVVFGEQVASKDGLGWLDLVCADLEGSGYAVGAADLCAAGVGAPHIRQRLWFVGLADADNGRRDAWLGHAVKGRDQLDAEGCVEASGLADAEHAERGQIGEHRKDGRDGSDIRRQEAYGIAGARSEVHGLADASSLGRREVWIGDHGGHDGRQLDADVEDGDSGGRPGPTNGFWRDADWLFCRDGKWRPVEPGAFPLVDGSTARMGRLRGYGNAIVPQVAETFIRSVMEC